MTARIRSGPWLAVLTVAFAMGLAGSVWAVPPHPEVWDELARRGTLAGILASDREAAKSGLNQPNPRAPSLRAGRERVAGEGSAERRAGDAVILAIPVILVDFPDNPAAASGPEDAGWFQTLLFSEGAMPWGSMREYYSEASYGNLALVGQVSGWHRMPNDYSFYTNGTRGTDAAAYPRNARKLVEDAVRLADAADPTLDFGQFDRSGPAGVPDGVIDGLIIVHAGPGYEETGISAHIHSHFWTVVEEDLMLDGVRISTYVIGPQNGRIGVYAHEFGHNLGLPDLYDTSGATQSTGVGVWAIMGFGSWLGPSGIFGPDSGALPSHPSAWSKVKLGFVEPINVESNLSGASIRPVEDHPDIYRLWTNGRASTETFLVENRMRRKFDAALPFTSDSIGGLLVWHVDEERPTNNDLSHMLCALEQADGRRDLENMLNMGDAGDAFGLGGRFTPATNPSSRSYDGADVQIRIDNIVPVLDDGSYTADLVVETRPFLQQVAIRIDDTQNGNGDGGLDTGEEVALELDIANIGLGATHLSLSLVSNDLKIMVDGGQIDVGALAADATATVANAAQIRVGALDRDPYPVDLRLHYTADGIEQEEALLLVAGDVIGFESAVTTEDAGFWAHHPGRQGYRDDWHLSTTRFNSAGHAWHCAPAGAETYADRTDGLLETPVIAVDGQARLFFWQWIDAEIESSDRAWDGGLVEISMNGGPWQQIEPEGGYSHTIIRNQDSPISDRPVFSGQREWHQVEFDLSGFEGAARLRFRFGSDGSVTEEGWYVDDVVVASPAQPYSVAFLAPTITAAGEVAVSWELSFFFGDQYEGRGFNVYRRLVSDSFPLGAVSIEVPPGYEQLTASPLAADATFVDTRVSEAETYEYLLEDLATDDSNRRFYGPRRVFVQGSVPAPSVVRALPNPFQPSRGAATLQVVIPEDAGGGDAAVRIGVFNSLGRLVRNLVDETLPPGKREVSWDGRTDAGVVAASGVYFVAMQAMGKSDATRLVLVR